MNLDYIQQMLQAGPETLVVLVTKDPLSPERVDEMRTALGEQANLSGRVVVVDGSSIDTAVVPRRDIRFAQMVMDLDRCEHGRHQGDNCFGCNGPSEGNPHMPPGLILGYNISGRPYVVPSREGKYDPDAWHYDPEKV